MHDHNDSFPLGGKLFIIACLLMLLTALAAEILLRWSSVTLVIDGVAWYLLWSMVTLGAVAFAAGIVTLCRPFDSHIAGYTRTIAGMSAFFALLHLSIMVVPQFFQRRARARVWVATTETETPTVVTVLEALGHSWLIVQMLFLGIAVVILGILLVRRKALSKRTGQIGSVLGMFVLYSVVIVALFDGYYLLAYLLTGALYLWGGYVGVYLLTARESRRLRRV